MRADLESRARTLGVQNRVRFLGFVNQSGLPAVYRSSDVMVLPSEYEAFGVVVLEAMLCGCPVIVSDHVGARFDLVREGEVGFVYALRDVNGLAQLLRRILSDPQRRKRMGEAARERMSDWSPDHSIDATVQAIETAIRLHSHEGHESRA